MNRREEKLLGISQTLSFEPFQCGANHPGVVASATTGAG
jgi:hypothetical protein